MECPACKLTNPDTAIKCNCGFDFTTGSINSVSYTNPHHKQAAPVILPKEVSIKDIDMPFGSMIKFMVKWAIASIPAMIIISILYFVIAALVGGGITAITQQ